MVDLGTFCFVISRLCAGFIFWDLWEDMIGSMERCDTTHSSNAIVVFVLLFRCRKFELFVNMYALVKNCILV
ncbi:hypothetical protein CDL12_23484 [Handroanthus impetiginosus]|uniref:Uncharacterized protein n=1 Tax=Handroanthus impetiginosus TaxID=429701 RepID=A0A2G9GFC0_9LAMI|nr:hypothetical protein CDL12_23484 [Handroanthus impetiginosus]